jgi:hypothetical protein
MNLQELYEPWLAEENSGGNDQGFADACLADEEKGPWSTASSHVMRSYGLHWECEGWSSENKRVIGFRPSLE